jgi:hypothetical protein
MPSDQAHRLTMRSTALPRPDGKSSKTTYKACVVKRVLMPERSVPAEVQARIDALLAAGMTTSAAKFIHDERGIQTFGKAPGRALARLHAAFRPFFAHGAK